MNFSDFITDNELRSLLMYLEEQPDRIKSVEFDLQCCDEQVYKSNMDKIECDVTADVSAVLGEDNKPVFKTVAARANEVQRRLYADEEYQKVKELFMTELRKKRELQTNMFRMKDQYKGMIAKAGLLSAIIIAESTNKNLQSKIKEHTDGN
jgi:hypothetical protein